MILDSEPPREVVHVHVSYRVLPPTNTSRVGPTCDPSAPHFSGTGSPGAEDRGVVAATVAAARTARGRRARGVQTCVETSGNTWRHMGRTIQLEHEETTSETASFFGWRSEICTQLGRKPCVDHCISSSGPPSQLLLTRSDGLQPTSDDLHLVASPCYEYWAKQACTQPIAPKSYLGSYMNSMFKLAIFHVRWSIAPCGTVLTSQSESTHGPDAFR